MIPDETILVADQYSSGTRLPDITLALTLNVTPEICA